MSSSVINREKLATCWSAAFTALKQELGGGFDALKCSRTASRHGTCTDVLICRIYDGRQSEATLPWVYCCYCLNHDPVEFETTGNNWCLKLHLNIVRLYFPDREKVVKLFREKLPSVLPAGFKFVTHPRQLVIEKQFKHDGNEQQVVSWVRPHLDKLIRKTYPILDHALTIAEAGALTKEQRRQLPKTRLRLNAPAANAQRKGDRRALNRSIPPSLRSEVIAANCDGKCRICGKPCRPEDIHIDHITPVAQGGLTVPANLRVTCRNCNLRRGSGRPRPAGSHIPAKPRPYR